MSGSGNMGNIEVRRIGAAQVMGFNRPEKKNALTGEMYDALSDALEAGDRDGSVAVHVFLGGNGVFTAGNDIGEFLTSSGGDQAVLKAVLRFIRLLPRVAKPMLAGVDGLAVGIGTTLLFHCDLVYASPTARFQTPFLDLGLVPEAASSLLMPARMGYARAFEMLVLGKVKDAAEMHSAGLVNAIVASDQLEAEVMGVAGELARKPPAALAQARRLMRGDVETMSRRTDEEAAIFARQLQSAEAREAFQAFLEKRAPDFSKPPGDS
jgi:enoyl-CoA hydratase/carnithine racemase